MPDWLTSTFQSDADVSISMAAGRLGAAFVLGCVVAGVYRATHGKGGEQSRALMATLVLLTVLICMLTIVIGNNVARAFSLVGALAIVRFRTVVEDTRDTAFVIFAVCVGMAVGAGYLKIPLLGIPMAAAAAFLFSGRGVAPGQPEYVLTVRMGMAHALTDALLRDAFGGHVLSARLTGVGTARQGASFERVYSVRLVGEESAPALVAALHGMDGVQGVELRRA